MESINIQELNLDQLRQLKVKMNLLISSQTKAQALSISSKTWVYKGFLDNHQKLKEDVAQELWDMLKITPSRSHKPSAVRYMWFSPTSNYKFNGHPELEARPLTTLLTALLQFINICLGTSLDSLLIAFYESGEIAVPPHLDNESSIDQNFPIANTSIGVSRILQMSPAKGSPCQGEASFKLEDGDLHVMEPSCQETFVHSVPAQPLLNGRRICISARKAKAVDVTPPAPLAPRWKPQPSRLPSVNTRPRANHRSRTAAPPPGCSTLLLGTSISTKVNLEPSVTNISMGGATIADLKQNIIDYSESEPQHPDKIIIICGTKEVLRASLKRAQELKPSLEDLLSTASGLFPHSSITFVSLLPINLRHKRTQRSYRQIASKVLGFNRLVRYLCRTRGLTYLDIFNKFLDPQCRNNVDTSLYHDHIHLNHSHGIPKLESELINSLSKPQTAAVRPRTSSPKPCASFSNDTTPPPLSLSNDVADPQLPGEGSMTGTPAPAEPAVSQSPSSLRPRTSLSSDTISPLLSSSNDTANLQLLDKGNVTVATEHAASEPPATAVVPCVVPPTEPPPTPSPTKDTTGPKALLTHSEPAKPPAVQSSNANDATNSEPT